MRFVANLRNETIAAFAAEDIQPRAYLLSSHRVTPATLDAAARVRGLGLPLFADNGSKQLIDQVIDVFADDAASVHNAVREIRRDIGHVPRGSDIPEPLRRTANDLANSVISHATAVSKAVDREALIELQLAMDPTDLIAQEDFAVACLLALQLEREITGFSTDRFATRNRRSLRLWKAVSEDPRCADVRVHAVLSAVDFNTARKAGQLAAANGVRCAAVGIAGINLDSSATDFFIIGTGNHSLERPAPRRYVRIIQILKGLNVGLRQSGGGLNTFHCLGLGAAAMMPIVAASFDERVVLTTDATSPIHDAIRDQVYYELGSQGGRVSTSAIANREVHDKPWQFESPFERQFRDTFGHDVGAAKAWWLANGQPQITRSHLRSEIEINEALPLLAEMDPEVRRRSERVRVAANHWTIGEHAASFAASQDRHALARASMREFETSLSTTIARGSAAAGTILDIIEGGA